jgi:hypothetical protein
MCGDLQERAVASSPDILIGDTNGQHVLIRPLSRSPAGLFEQRDGNWIDCEIAVSAGAFRGTVRADLRPEEFRSFLEEVEELKRTPDSTATFAATEGQLALSLQGAEQEQIRITGEAIDEAGGGNRLQFRFDIDRGALTDVCDSLEHLLDAFPLVEVPQA